LGQQAGRREGLIAVLKALEPCSSFEVRKDHALGRLALIPKTTKACTTTTIGSIRCSVRAMCGCRPGSRSACSCA
jgi:hypothetical protein